jgi:hypothetical protein
MSPLTSRDGRDTLAICAIAIVLATAIAILVHVAFAGQVRGMLDFTFPGVDAGPGVAWSIFATNVRKLAGILGLVLVLQSPWLAGDRHTEDRPSWHPALTTLCDCAVAGALGLTFLVAAAGLGAYGVRMVRAIVPHGPIELLAFATALGLYRNARRCAIPPRRVGALVAICVLALALAALVETYITL